MLQPDNDTFHDYRIDSVAYPGFQREGCLRSGGGGVGGWGRFRSDIRKVAGGGGGPFRFRSDTFGHTENMYIIEYTRRLIINNTKYIFTT